MYIIIYSPKGQAISDFALPRFIETMKENLKSAWVAVLDNDWIEHVSTENVLNEVRCAIREGQLPHDKIVIQFRNTTINIDSNGRYDSYPADYPHCFSNQLDRLISEKIDVYNRISS